MPPLGLNLTVLDSNSLSYRGGENGSVQARMINSALSTIRFEGKDTSTACIVKNVAAPSEPLDVANKQYVDNRFDGFSIKPSVQLASTKTDGNITFDPIPAPFELDGTTVFNGTRILLMHQTTESENGVWIFDGSTSPAFVRPVDFTGAADAPNSAKHASGAQIFVDQGIINRDRSYVCTSDKGVDLVDTDPLQFTLYSARPLAFAGSGLTIDEETPNGLKVDENVVVMRDKNNVLSGINEFTGSSVAFSASTTVSIPDLTGIVTANIAQPSDAINLEYLENHLEKLKYKLMVAAVLADPVATVTTASLIVGFQVDQVTLSTGDRVLVTRSATTGMDGVYVVQASGAAVRSEDFAPTLSARGFVVPVAPAPVGSVYGGRIMLCVSPAATSTIGTHPLDFQIYGSQPGKLIGTSIGHRSATEGLDLLYDDSVLKIDTANQVTIKPSGVVTEHVADNAITNAKIDKSTYQYQHGRGIYDDQTAQMGTLNLGDALMIDVDYTIVADKYDNNTFGYTQDNTVTTQTVDGYTVLGSRVQAEANSTTSGSLQVRGGAGIMGNVYTGGMAVVGSTTESTSATTGALQVKGGAGIVGDVRAGGIAAVGSTANEEASDTTSGSLQVTGGAGITGNVYTGGMAVVGSTTESTSATTGALQVKGGAGIVGDVRAGGIAAVGSTANEEASDTTSGSLQVTGGAGITGNVYTGGMAVVGSTTQSTSAETGALQVKGGAGIKGDVYVGNDIYIQNSMYNYSDQRLKTDIVPLDGALETIENIRGCNFTWKHNQVSTVGVIAQEVLAAGADRCVQTEGEYYAVDYTKLVPYLIEAVKELSARVRKYDAMSANATDDGTTARQSKRQRSDSV